MSTHHPIEIAGHFGRSSLLAPSLTGAGKAAQARGPVNSYVAGGAGKPEQSYT